MTDIPEKGTRRPDPAAFGGSIPNGLGLNLLYADLDRAARFQAEVLGAEIVYWEDHFAIMRALGSVWQLHSDWSYRDNALRSAFEGVEARGAGAEFRLYGLDPDAAVSRARAAGAIVLADPMDKPHGLREALILDAEGYVWAPSKPLSD